MFKWLGNLTIERKIFDVVESASKRKYSSWVSLITLVACFLNYTYKF